ncbi:MAG: phenylalanine--tRNA ligase subunit beta [Acidobacteriota bacterium]|nr:phenylalanine--tRNA ligase subunit beta [Acidobacteriota bacterium]
MKILTNWLRTYVPNIPADDHKLAEDLTLRGIAVEGVHDLGPGNGHLFEMDITTNRVDAMNHYGIAREAATIYNLPLLPLLAQRENGGADKADKPASPPTASTHPSFPIRIDAPELCGRFTAQVLRNVTIGTSTGHIAEYFQLLGQKQIANAVDASNFVLLGMGHPTHAFDLDKIHGSLVVRLARAGETIKLLDGTDRALEPDDLVVADQAKPLALAGVMGGYDSMITPDTRNILVEAAWFDPASIRRSARRHGLHTDASHRFERGADFNACPTANRLVSQLILEHGGHTEGDLLDIAIPEIAARTANRPPITLSVKQVQRHLGSTLDDARPDHAGNNASFEGGSLQSALTAPLVHQYLTALGCTLTTAPAGIRKTGMVNPLATHPATQNPSATNPETQTATNPDSQSATKLGAPGSIVSSSNLGERATTLAAFTQTFQVQLPSWRLDIEREIDLIEEVARVYGYNRFANTLPTPGIVLAHPLAQKEAAVRTRLLALGFSESISTTFASQQDTALFFERAQHGGAPSSAPLHTPKVGLRENEPPSSHTLTNPGAPYLDAEMGASSAARLHTTHPVALENPLSEEAFLLRPTLVPGMVAMLAQNLNRDVREVRLFEQGHIFTGTLVPDSTVTDAVQESAQLTLGLTSANPNPTPLHPAADAPFFELKGALESLFSLFHLGADQRPSSPPGQPALTFTADAPAWLQPGRCASALLHNQPVAYFGELSGAETQRRKLRQPIFLAQLDLARLYGLPLKQVIAHDLSRFQAVERDFSFTFPDTMPWHTLASAIDALGIPELQRLGPTEIFRDPKGKSVPPAHYAILLKCVFQSHDRTLREDELTSWWSSIISTLTQLGGVIRAPAEN